MLEEVGQPYETQIMGYDTMKDAQYLAVNPMGKVPAIKHNGHVVTEAAAIWPISPTCSPKLPRSPRQREGRLLSLALLRGGARPSRRSPITTPNGTRRPSRAGCSATAATTASSMCSTSSSSLRDYVCGGRFTAADVYVGSAVIWGTQFGTLPKRDSFARYSERLQGREAFKRARQKDDEAQAQIQPQQPQPA